jgi:hypothetical protein
MLFCLLVLQLAAIAKTQVAWQRLLLLSILGGFYVMIGGLLRSGDILTMTGATATSIAGAITTMDTGIQKFLFALTFPVGLVMSK